MNLVWEQDEIFKSMSIKFYSFATEKVNKFNGKWMLNLIGNVERKTINSLEKIKKKSQTQENQKYYSFHFESFLPPPQ